MQIVAIIIKMISNPSDLLFFDYMRKFISEGASFLAGSGKFTISEPIFTYSISIIVLLIAAGIAKKLFAAGIKLIDIETKNLVNEMVTDWREERQLKRERQKRIEDE